MRTIEQKVFKFNELSKEVQEKVIAKWYENEDYPFLTDDLTEALNSMENQCFYDVKLSYSLSSCQGDGLSFAGTLDFEKFLVNIYSKHETLKPSIKKALLELVYKVYSTGKSKVWHYPYAWTGQIEFEYNHEDKAFKRIKKLFESEIFPEIQKYYMDACKSLEKEGYSILEYRMSIDEFTDMSDSNEYEYFENGKML
jgi:hypothetical protein